MVNGMIPSSDTTLLMDEATDSSMEEAASLLQGSMHASTQEVTQKTTGTP